MASPVDPVHLAPRERLVACLFADGQNAAEISAQTLLSRSTIYSMVKYTRRRYVAAGRPAPSKLELRRRLVEDGHLPSP